jgi:two-component system, OmpR family, heavy metal sensor histidine kinase CusS
VRVWSVRERLTLWYTAVLSLGLILLSCTVWLALDRILHQELSNTLLNQTQGLQEYIRIEDEENTLTLPHEIDEFAHALPHHHVLVIANPGGGVVYRSGDAAPIELLPLAGQKAFTFHGRHYFATASDLPLKDRRLRVTLALSSEEIDHPVKLLGVILLVVVPVFIICGVVGGRWLSRRALQPVADITKKAREIGLSNLSERLPVPETDDEIQRLTETWNDMLGRLELAVSRISQFTADASHELRTPIAVVRLAAENALRKMRSETDYRGALERIQQQAEGMTRLIEDLLFLARADVQGQWQPAFQAVDLGAIAASVASDLQPLAVQKGLDLRIELPQGGVAVWGDESSLRRLILILLDNGIKYTPKDGRVGLRISKDAERHVLAVSDTGIGISQENTPLLFERFFRTDPSRNKESGGYGLGLAIAKAIAQAHDAQIQVASSPGEGSAFMVSFQAREFGTGPRRPTKEELPAAIPVAASIHSKSS